MTREEQTIQAAKDFLPNITNAQLTLFAAGAMWADEHPDLYSVTRKAVERERKYLIDKVCKWLEENTEDYTEYIYESDTDDYNEEDNLHFAVASNYDYKKDFIEAFRKAIEQ